MVSSDFRKEARSRLEGKWGKAALITLVYFGLSLVLSFIENNTKGLLNSIIGLAVAVIEIPLAYGIIISLMKLFKGEDVGAFDFFSAGFDNFGRSWSVAWHTFLKVLVPFIVFAIAMVLVGIGTAGAFFVALSSESPDVSTGGITTIGIIGGILGIAAYVWLMMQVYYYQLAQLVAIDNTQLSGKEAVLESKRLMEGNRWKLFCLHFSFIGWIILACLTFGIGMLWLFPYMQFAVIAFYKHILNKTEVVTEAPKEETPANDVQE